MRLLRGPLSGQSCPGDSVARDLDHHRPTGGASWCRGGVPNEFVATDTRERSILLVIGTPSTRVTLFRGVRLGRRDNDWIRSVDRAQWRTLAFLKRGQFDHAWFGGGGRLAARHDRRRNVDSAFSGRWRSSDGQVLGACDIVVSAARSQRQCANTDRSNTTTHHTRTVPIGAEKLSSL